MIKTEGNIRDSYKIYKTLTHTPESIKDYTAIANDYMKFLMEKVLEGEEVTLPARMGTLSITGKQRKIRFREDGTPVLPPNWAKTKKLWERNEEAKLAKKLVYCTNEETNGVVYKVHWSKNRVPIENKSFYSFRLTRTNKRAISDAIKRGVEYFFKPI